jgi:acyl-CoA thioester hydrolase
MSVYAPYHHISFRIYYEDTDAGGVVYYANYLKFAERARTEWLRALGFEQRQLTEKEHVLLMVRRCGIDFLAPARLDDEILVETRLKELGKVRMTMQQAISRDDRKLALIDVEIACVGMDGKPVAWPEVLLKKFREIEELTK